MFVLQKKTHTKKQAERKQTTQKKKSFVLFTFHPYDQTSN